MKLKPFTGIALTVAMATGAWLWFHHPVTPTQPAELLVSKLVKPDITSLPKPVPANAPKMMTVASKPAGVPAPTLSPAASDWSAVQMIVDTRASYEERLKAIGSLSSRLTDSDWEVLQPFLLQPDGLDRSQLGQVIKNELLDKLCALNPPPAGIGDVLIKMYRDQHQDEVIRDYAVQHLAAYYEQLGEAKDNAKIRQTVKSVLWNALTETGDSIAGTALLGLERLSRGRPEFDQNQIAMVATQLAGDKNAGELTHITAYQICGRLGTADALPVVLSAARNGETISVKLSAIGSLGQLGGPDQTSFLKELLQGDEERLKPAAQHALEQITTRQNQLASQK